MTPKPRPWTKMTQERQCEALAELKKEMAEQIEDMIREIQDMFDNYQVPYKVTMTPTLSHRCRALRVARSHSRPS